ncbi:hypothetical protein IW261DRAFT_1450330 [Armillaria novae-zelandiae]|uniref:BZIP domain-containing protein n=1 Tax=Armillaria novae-zelandiae TaxID=153914 RepID=A0AA39PNZ5_9AGAR|nr:hypothetical protein IW261DRAFT_1450330 [Armillaria novae-zelandiae]
MMAASSSAVNHATVWRYSASSSLLLSPANHSANDEVMSSTLTMLNSPSRSPSVSPSTSSLSSLPQPVAISDFRHNPYITKSQDVRFVNNSATTCPSSSTATRNVSTATPLESPLSSFPAPHHASINYPLSTLPRVSFDQKDLASQYGIPTVLPQPPNTAPRRNTQPKPAPPAPSSLSHFEILQRNYLAMLNQPSSSNSTVDSTATMQLTVTPADLLATAGDDFSEELGDWDWLFFDEDGLTDLSSPGSSPLFKDLDEFPSSNFLTGVGTSPLLDTPYSDTFDSFETSPFDTPLDSFLTTPIFQDGDVPLISDADEPMFSSYEELLTASAPPSAPAKVPQLPDMTKLYTMSPTSPAVDFIDPASVYPSPRLPVEQSPLPSPSAAARPTKLTPRKSSATGTRKNITPETMVPLDAPTQPRRYVIPSATSRKEVPATFARKRSRSVALGGDEEDELEPPPPDATDRQMIEYKRRQNTLAARKSRKRKLEHQQLLEDKVETLTLEVEQWRTKAEIYQSILQSHNISFQS